MKKFKSYLWKLSKRHLAPDSVRMHEGLVSQLSSGSKAPDRFLRAQGKEDKDELYQKWRGMEPGPERDQAFKEFWGHPDYALRFFQVYLDANKDRGHAKAVPYCPFCLCEKCKQRAA